MLTLWAQKGLLPRGAARVAAIWATPGSLPLPSATGLLWPVVGTPFQSPLNFSVCAHYRRWVLSRVGHLGSTGKILVLGRQARASTHADSPGMAMMSTL